MQDLTPSVIVKELDKHIIGQMQAKRAVAIALRNRWRRMQLQPEAQAEINPKNILMIGPTGVGKTEIARRLAKLVKAPFTKVEATKFTEVGYVGREVDSIIRDLVEVAYSQCREQALADNQAEARTRAEQRLLDVILRPSKDDDQWQAKSSKTRDMYLTKLRNGELDDKEVDIETTHRPNVEIMAPPGMEEMVGKMQNLFSSMRQDQTEKRTVKISQAFVIFRDEEAAKLLDDQELRNQAVSLTEQSGIVFIDEIDKIIRSGSHQGDVSREGVQRDLLPLVEGSSVSTRLGTVRTDFILFIASGAFQLAKPSDLIPELQGRLPIRVTLDSLGVNELQRILTEPNINLLEQYRLLMQVEKIALVFENDAITRIAEIAHSVNQSNENIGARRLHTMLEKLLDELSFEANCKKTRKVSIDGSYVDKRLGTLSENEDLSRYVL